MNRRVLLARANHDIQNQAQAAHIVSSRPLKPT